MPVVFVCRFDMFIKIKVRFFFHEIKRIMFALQFV